MASLVDLPFKLFVMEGEGGSAKRLPLRSFSTQERVLPEPVRFTENLPLTLELQDAEDTAEIAVIWDELVYLDEKPDERVIVLGRDRREVQLSRVGEEYPWRCGLYQFRVIHNGVTYFGAYEIIPRNFTGSQMQQLHETINQHLEGLVADYLVFKNSVSADHELEEVAHWRFFSWYKTKERELLNAISGIEASSDMELYEAYQVESVPRSLTAKSVRWAATAQGARYQGFKYYNRRMQQHADSPANRLVKHWLASIVVQMQEAMASLRGVYTEFASEYDKISEELEEIQKSLEGMKGSKVVSKQDRENLGSTYFMKKKEQEKITQRLRSLQRLEFEYKQYQSALRNVLASGYWRDIGNQAPRRIVLGQHPAYRLVYAIWNESLQWGEVSNKDQKKRPVAVAKPTSLLYEYYVLFKAVEAFRKLGFTHDTDTITVQLEQYFNGEGLQDGTQIKLHHSGSGIAIDITYDELVETHDHLAISHNTHFFSNEHNRKPDIRIDLFTVDEDGARSYESSIVLEVKYRPLWNIYSELGNTETMLQMNKYYAIKYVQLVNGRKRYNRSPIHQVICTYPGDPNQELLKETGSGLFLQLYPGEQNETVGLEVLVDQFRAWLEMYMEV